MEDKELIRRIQNGEKDYLNVIADKYYDDIYYFCCYRIGNREDAYDLAQDTFLRFIRYVEQYKYQNLKGYLLTIAMNLCRDYCRSQASADYQAAEEAMHPEPGSKAIPMQVENNVILFDALMKLPDIQREAVLLHHFYGYKNREIAHMTGASYAAVKSRVKQGLAKLHQLLNKEDFYES